MSQPGITRAGAACASVITHSEKLGNIVISLEIHKSKKTWSQEKLAPWEHLAYKSLGVWLLCTRHPDKRKP